MKNLIRFSKNFLYAGIVLLFLNSCENDKPTLTHDSHPKSDNTITFSQFKKETNIPEFSTVFKSKISFSGDNARATTVAEDFVIDTTAIEKRSDNNPTYSFFAYPLNYEKAGENEIFNLVYYKENGKWETIIFSFEKKAMSGSNDLYENIKQVYSSSSRNAVCWGTEYKFHCTRTGPCAGGNCDLCNLCVSSSAVTVPCGGGATNPEDPSYGTGNPEVGINPGGGGIPVKAFITALQLNPYQQGFLELNPYFKARLIENYIDLPSISAVAEIRDEFKAKVDYMLNHPEMCQNIVAFVEQQQYREEAQKFGWQLINLAQRDRFVFELDNTPTSNNSIEINTIEDLTTSLEQLEINSVETELLPSQANAFIGTYKFKISVFIGLKMNVKFSVSPQYHHTVSNVNSALYGFNMGDWEHEDHIVTILPNGNTKVEAVGTITFDHTIGGWGLKIAREIRLILILNPADATIVSSSWHYN